MSFDSDRAMDAFMGDVKNTSAVRCFVAIAYTVTQLIRPKFEANYDTVKNATFSMHHATGIDQGTVFLVRGGVYGSSELISIGGAQNLAAKLSDIRDGNYSTFVTKSVYDKASKSTKERLDGSTGVWEARTWKYCDEPISIYRSSHWRKQGSN